MSDNSEKGVYARTETDDVTAKNSVVVPLDDADTSSEAAQKPQELADSPILAGRDLYLVFVGVALTLFMASLDNTIVATSLPQIASEFQALGSISWVATAYLLAANAMQPVYGKLSDIFGRKAAYMLAISLFLVGSALCGAAQSISMLIGARAVQGLGAAGCFSLSMVIATESSGVREAGKFMGILSGVFALSSVLGPIVGGALTDISHSSWRWIFYINLPIGLPTLALIFFFLKLIRSSLDGNFRQKIARIDFLGIFIFVAGVICILLALTWGGNTYPWKSAQVIALLCVGVVLLAIFIFVEVRVAREPIIPMELFTKHNYAVTTMVTLPFGTVMFGLIFFIPLYFQVIKGEKAVTSGLHLIPLMCGLALLAGISGFLVSKTGIYRPFIWFGTALSTVGVGLLVLWEADSSNASYICFPLIIGVGMGFCMQTIMSAGQSQLDRTTLASGTALINFFRTIGGVFGLAIFSAVLNSKLASEIELSRPNDSEFVIDIARKGFLVFNQLNAEQLTAVKEAYVVALRSVFIAMIPFAGITFLLSLFYRHVPLPSRKDASGPPTPPSEPADAEKSLA